jgi:hypothetical protein
MNVVRRHHIIVEHREAETFLGCEESEQVTASVPRKLASALISLRRLEQSEAVERLERLELVPA